MSRGQIRPFIDLIANNETETSSIDSMTQSEKSRDGSDVFIAQLEPHINSLGSEIDEDFSSLKQENGSLSDQIINTDTSQKRTREETDTSLGDEAIFKVKQKQPRKNDSHQNHANKDCVITERGQEPEPVPKSRPDPYQELKSERGPGQKRDRETGETESNRSTKVFQSCHSKSTDPRAGEQFLDMPTMDQKVAAFGRFQEQDNK